MYLEEDKFSSYKSDTLAHYLEQNNKLDQVSWTGRQKRQSWSTNFKQRESDGEVLVFTLQQAMELENKVKKKTNGVVRSVDLFLDNDRITRF